MCAGLVFLPLRHRPLYRRLLATVLICINAMMACARGVPTGARTAIGDGDVAMWFQWLLVVACGLVVLVSIASWRQHPPGQRRAQLATAVVARPVTKPAIVGKPVCQAEGDAS